MKSHGVVWPAQGRVEIEELEIGDPGPGELLLEAECTLISPGTERAFLLNLPNTSGKYPMRPGYNFAGRVLATGRGVETIKVGQRVVAAAPHAAHALVRAEKVLQVPDGLALEEAVFFNMAGIALQGVRRADIGLGEGVAVIGQGLVGLLAVQLSRLQGGLPVIAIDPVEKRRELGRQSGADVLVDPQDEEQMAALMAGGGPPVVIEATGASEPINMALGLVRPAGRVVLLASTRGETLVNFYRDVHRKGIAVIGAHNGARPLRESSARVWIWEEDGRAVLELLRYGRLQVKHLISHRLKGSQAPQAYELLKAWSEDLLGVVLEW